MDTQNITLSIPKNTLRKIKIIAARQQTSVSALLSKMMEELVNEESGYTMARKRQLDLLEQGFNLGLNASQPAAREELHER
jgi:hypothetical protein